MKQLIPVLLLLLPVGCGRAPPAGPVFVYQIDPATTAEGVADNKLIEEMVGAIDRRLNGGGPNRAKVAARDDGMIEVHVYRDDPEIAGGIRGLVERRGTLEFRIAAHRRHPELRRWIEDTQPGGAYPFPEEVVRDGQVLARWMPLGRVEAEELRVRERTLAVLRRSVGVSAEELADERLLDELADDDSDLEAIWKALGVEFGNRAFSKQFPSEDRQRLRSVGEMIHYIEAAVTVGLQGEIAWEIDPERGLMLLLVEPLGEDEPRDRRGLRFAAVTGEHLRRATTQVDSDGSPSVGFVLDRRGTFLFGRLTTAYAPESDGFQSRLAILLDGAIHSAPDLREPITGGTGQISGEFTVQEVSDLVDALNAGALPADLELVSEYRIGSGR